MSKLNIKNPVFIENSTDETGQFVNSVYAKKTSKLGREIWYMVWQYYRHRGKLSVKKVIKENKQQNHELRINYSIFSDKIENNKENNIEN